MQPYVFLLLIVSAGASPPPKKYRDDYIYSKITNAYLKLHEEFETFFKASRICQIEGAGLVLLRTDEDIAEMHGLFKKYEGIGNVMWIAGGAKGSESIEKYIMDMNILDDMDYENAECPSLTRDGEVRKLSCIFDSNDDMQLPFVCKVDADKAPYDPRCNVYSNDYTYNAAVGSCYKISKTVASWNEAYAECVHEGAHLVVLNSAAERDVVKQLMSAAPLLDASHLPYYYIAGIRANEDANNATRVFRTIFNETLEAAGFAEWAATEPNNLGGNEFCGSLYEYDGKYNDQGCDQSYAFICEKETTSN